MSAIDTTPIREPFVPPTGANEEKEENDLSKSRVTRQNRMEEIVHWSKIVIIIICVIIVIGAIVCRVLHLFLPASKQWLTAEQVSKIDEFFVHGTIGAIVVGAINKFVKTTEAGEGL